jgi:hypothetical protein
MCRAEIRPENFVLFAAQKMALFGGWYTWHYLRVNRYAVLSVAAAISSKMF